METQQPRCNLCRWWSRLSIQSDPREVNGQCRRRSPVISSVPVEFEGRKVCPSMWPLTPADSFCGEADIEKGQCARPAQGPIRVNLNQTVRVTLSECGQAFMFAHNGPMPGEYDPQQGRIWTGPLWRLMQAFGNGVTDAREGVFVDNVIEIICGLGTDLGSVQDRREVPVTSGGG